jgi:hypothetical protein
MRFTECLAAALAGGGPHALYPRRRVNDGKILVFVDLSEINYKPLPTRSPAGHHPVTVSPQSAGRGAASGAGQT